MINKPDGIIKCMPVAWVKNLPHGLEAWEKTFMKMNDLNDYYWKFNLSGTPKYEVLYFYLAFDGCVRYRANIIGYSGAGTLKCYSGEMHHGKVWVHIAAPVIKAAEPVSMLDLFGKKGFQGFRYTEKLF